MSKTRMMQIVNSGRLKMRERSSRRKETAPHAAPRHPTNDAGRIAHVVDSSPPVALLPGLEDDPVPDLARLQVLEGVVHLEHREQLGARPDVVPGAELQHPRGRGGTTERRRRNRDQFIPFCGNAQVHHTRSRMRELHTSGSVGAGRATSLVYPTLTSFVPAVEPSIFTQVIR